MKIEIRKTELSDLDSIYSIEKEFYTQPYKIVDLENWLDKPNMILLTLLSNMIVSGYLIATSNPPESELYKISITFTNHHRGLGKRLLETYLTLCRKNGVSTVFLEVGEKNHKALSFYRKNGFTEYLLRENYYGNENAICLKKELI
jgi:ribosomal protein S18 acetylase RimI-like enzyme